MNKIEALNDIVTGLGGTGGYKYEIQALNAWAVLVGAAGAYKYEIQALNAIDKAKGGTGLHKYNIDALNSICKAAGGSGLNKYEIAALAFIGSLLNYGNHVVKFIGYSATKDTSISSGSPDLNYALDVNGITGENALNSYVWRTLIDFGADSAPEYTNIVDFFIYLKLNNILSTWRVNAALLEVRKMKRTWVEGTKNGIGTADGATWNTYDGVNAWTEAGGLHINDCDSEVIGSVILEPKDDGVKCIDLNISEISELSQFGYLLKTQNENSDAYIFSSKNNHIASNRPKLYLAAECLKNGTKSPVFEKYGTKLFQGSFGSVVYVNDNLYYSYNGSRGIIYMRTSTDGLAWSSAYAVLYGLGDYGGVPFAWKEGDNWYMLYRSSEYTTELSICLATSSDGIVWTKSASNPVITKIDVGAWVTNHLDPWGVIKVEDTYYLHLNNTGEYPRQSGQAYSTDLINWTMVSATPLFDNERFCADIFKYKDKYYSIVCYNPLGEVYVSNKYCHRLELYRSDTPIFTLENREFLGNILLNSQSGWDSVYLDTPCVLTKTIQRDTFPKDKIWMYYTGAETASIWGMGLATLNFNIIDKLVGIDELNAGE